MRLSRFRYIDVSYFIRFLKFDISKFYLIKKEQIVLLCLSMGMLMAYYASLHVWFLWPFENTYTIISSLFLLTALLFSNSMENSILGRRDFLIPTIVGAVLLLYLLIVNNVNPKAFIIFPFQLFVFFILFRLDQRYLPWLAAMLCKSMAILLMISLPMFVLYLMGFPFPGRNADWHELYFFTNHYFFLISDGALSEIIPRFHSVFLEPGHMGTAIVLLLATQLGQWKKWYNVMLLIALFVSFSLAAYGLLTILVFLHLWMQRKKILVKVLALILLIAAVVGGSFVYNDGDNMLNQLIVMRLEVNNTGDGIEGDNRVTGQFEAEFNSYMQSSDIWFGREMDKSFFGNAGYRVFLYENGIIGFLLTYLFYLVAMFRSDDKRALISMLIISLANFWIRAYPLWFGFFIPYYIMAYWNTGNLKMNNREV